MEIDSERLKSLRQQALADSKRGEREAEQRRRTTLNSDRWNEIHRVMNDLPGMLEDAARRGIDTVEIYHKKQAATKSTTSYSLNSKLLVHGLASERKNDEVAQHGSVAAGISSSRSIDPPPD
jgi:hypothetical protein